MTWRPRELEGTTCPYLTSFSDIIGRTPTPSVGPSNAAAPLISTS